MKKIAITKTNLLAEYLEQSKFIKFESFEDCFIIYARDDQQLFWFGVGYGKFCSNK